MDPNYEMLCIATMQDDDSYFTDIPSCDVKEGSSIEGLQAFENSSQPSPATMDSHHEMLYIATTLDADCDFTNIPSCDVKEGSSIEGLQAPQPSPARRQPSGKRNSLPSGLSSNSGVSIQSLRAGSNSVVRTTSRTTTLLDEFRTASAFHAELQKQDLRTCKRLGSGTVSKVFKTTVNNEEVAAKILRVNSNELKAWPSFTDDFVGELRVVKQGLHHPNVTQFVGTGIAPYGGKMVPVILYEYMEGGSLEDVMGAKSSKLGTNWVPPRAQSLSWCTQLLSALEFLHARDPPMAHRDIKPANLLLSADLSTLKLADFSLAMPLHGESTDGADMPSIAGSFRYMAPEVFLQEKKYALEKADVYSAAVACWSMIYGTRPYAFVDSPDMLMTVVRQGMRPVCPSKDKKVCQVLSAAWDTEPSLRPPAVDFLAQLEKLELKESKKWSLRNLTKSNSFKARAGAEAASEHAPSQPGDVSVSARRRSMFSLKSKSFSGSPRVSDLTGSLKLAR